MRPPIPSQPQRATRRAMILIAAVVGAVIVVAMAYAVADERPEGFPFLGSGDPDSLAPLRSSHERTEDGTKVATLEGHAADAFEPMPFERASGGHIDPDPAWVEAHIETAEMPLLDGHVRCHERLIPQLEGALAELEERGLGHHIDPAQYGGCWVPRHILAEPDRALSLHAWGLAVDFNVHENPYGEEPEMDQRVVDVFERWGFAWGGDWHIPDGMHFELIEVRDEPRAD